MTPLVASAYRHKEGTSVVSDGNGLTAERVAALVPGDPVTVETAVSGRRPSLAIGTVVRIEPTAVIVAIPGRGGRGTFIERYSRAGRRPGGPRQPRPARRRQLGRPRGPRPGEAAHSPGGRAVPRLEPPPR